MHLLYQNFLCLIAFCTLLFSIPLQAQPSLHENDVLSQMSSGQLSPSHKLKNAPVLFDIPIDQPQLYENMQYDWPSILGVSEKYIKMAASKIYRWETEHYKVLSLQEIQYLGNLITSYNLQRTAAILKSPLPIALSEYDAKALEQILTKMPPIRAQLYYPVVIQKSQMATLNKRALYFDQYVIAPPHYISTDLSYTALKKTLTENEDIILLHIDPMGAHPVSIFSPDPENIDFIFHSQETPFQVTAEEDFQMGLYAKKYTIAPIPQKEQQVELKPLNISQHRTQSCL